MKLYPFPEKKWLRGLFVLYVSAMLLLARDTLVTTCLVGFGKSQVLGLALTALVGAAFLIWNRRSLKQILTDRRMLWAGTFALAMLVPMLIKRDWQLMYLSILFCPLTAILLSYFVTWQQVSKVYVSVLSVLAAYSLIASYGLKQLAMDGQLAPPVFFNSQNWDFYNFGLSFVVTWPAWFRNFGIFREPGVYQFFLLLGLYLNNYAVSWKHRWVLWLVNGLLTLTMLSTFSVAGLGVLALLAVFVYFDKRCYRTTAGKLALAAVVVALLAAVVGFRAVVSRESFGNSVFYEVYDMVLRLTSGSDSANDRLAAVASDLHLWLTHPVFGGTVVQVLHSTDHNTSSSLILFAILGLLGGGVHIASWAALCWDRKRALLGNLCLMAILFLSFNTQNLTADVFFWLIPVMALVQRSAAWSRNKGGNNHGKTIAAQGSADPAGDCPGDQAGL